MHITIINGKKETMNLKSSKEEHVRGMEGKKAKREKNLSLSCYTITYIKETILHFCQLFLSVAIPRNTLYQGTQWTNLAGIQVGNPYIPFYLPLNFIQSNPQPCSILSTGITSFYPTVSPGILHQTLDQTQPSPFCASSQPLLLLHPHSSCQHPISANTFYPRLPGAIPVRVSGVITFFQDTESPTVTKGENSHPTDKNRSTPILATIPSPVIWHQHKTKTTKAKTIILLQ